MRKIIEKSYCGLIFIFYALFTILIRMDANDHLLIYCLGLIVASAFLCVIPFFTNKSKKVIVRKIYLITMIIFAYSVSIIAIYYLLADIVNTNEILFNIKIWEIRITQIAFLIGTFLTIYYTLKDLMKKEYSIQKFDLQAFQMVINLLVCIAFYYVLFDYGDPTYLIHVDDLATGSTHSELIFDNFDTIKNVLLIISGIYILLYILLEVFKYIFFEKEKDNSTRKFN